MVGIFESQDIAAPQGGVSPQQAVAPVVDNTAGAVLGGLTQLAGVGLNLFEQNKKAAATKAKNDATGGFASYITNLNAAVEQGALKRTDAQRLQRAKFNSLITAHPELTDDLVQLNSGLAKSAGLGDTLAQGTAVDQADESLKKEAVGAGAITPSMSQQQQALALENYRTMKNAETQMEFASKQLALKNQQLGLVEKQANIANAQEQRAYTRQQRAIAANKLQAQQAVGQWTASQTGVYQSKAEHIIAQIQSGEVSREQGYAQIQGLQNEVMTATQGIRGVAGSDYVDGLASPLMKILGNYADVASGKVSADIARNRVNSIQDSATAEILSDPTLAKALTATKMLDQVTAAKVMDNFTPELLRKINQNGNANQGNGQPANITPDSNDASAMKSTRDYLGLLSHNIDMLSEKNPAVSDPKGLKAEVNAQVNSIFKAGSLYASAQESPKQLDPLMTFLSSDSFLKYRQMGGTLDSGNVGSLKNVLSSNWEDVLVPVAKEAWEKGKVVTGITASAGGFPAMGGVGGYVATTQAGSQDAIEFRWDGSSVSFAPAKQYVSNRAAQAKAAELNKTLAPIINKTVRAKAHLNGGQDYTAEWNSMKDQIFGGNIGSPAPQEATDANTRYTSPNGR